MNRNGTALHCNTRVKCALQLGTSLNSGRLQCSRTNTMAAASQNATASQCPTHKNVQSSYTLPRSLEHTSRLCAFTNCQLLFLLKGAVSSFVLKCRKQITFERYLASFCGHSSTECMGSRQVTPLFK
eukprot:208675-Amphidinium_carterae.1